MRTLKKTLCLVLCLAMMAGLCAIGASAKVFTDAADIENKEAVDLLVGLGIIEGYEDGSFNPSKILTRAEASKIIAYLLLGKAAADALPLADTKFTDVTAAHWASGFIGYAVSQGIVAGVSDTAFDPSAPLTAAAWAKMLLCALGYSQETEGLVGDGWDLNVTRLVARTKLADGIAFASTMEMTRDVACLLAFNALTVPMVEYVRGVSVTTGEGTKVDVNAEKEYRGYLADNYNLRVAQTGQYADQKDSFAEDATVKGVVTANSFNAVDGTKTAINGVNYNFQTGEELLGRYVIAYKDKAGKVISITEIGSVKEVEEDLAKAADVKAKFGDVKELEKNANGVYVFDAGAIVCGDYRIAADAAAAGTYVFDDQGKLAAKYLDTYPVVTLEKIADVVTTAEKESIKFASHGEDESLSNTAKTDTVREYDGIAKNDIVIAKQIGDLYYLEKTEPVEGAISKVDAKGKITLDGSVYAASTVATNNDAVADVEVAKLQAGTVALKNTVFQVYFYEGEYVAIVVKKADAAPFEPYFLKEKTDADGKDATVIRKNVLQSDNSIVEEFFVEVVDKNGEKSTVRIETADSVKDLKGELVMVKDKAGKDYKVITNEKIADAAKDAELEIHYLNKTYTQAKVNKYADKDGNEIRVNANTKFIFISENDKGATVVEVKTGLFDMKETAKQDMIAITAQDKDENDVAQYVFVIGEFAAETVVDPSTIVYVKAGTEMAERTVDGVTYTVYDAVKGEAKSILMADEDALDGFEGYYVFETDKDGYTTLDYIVGDDAKAIVMNGVYTEKYESAITVSDKEYNAADAIFVDLRAAAAIKTKITSIDTLNTEVKTNHKAVKLDMLLNDKGAPAIIFVK